MVRYGATVWCYMVRSAHHFFQLRAFTGPRKPFQISNPWKDILLKGVQSYHIIPYHAPQHCTATRRAALHCAALQYIALKNTILHRSSRQIHHRYDNSNTCTKVAGERELCAHSYPLAATPLLPLHSLYSSFTSSSDLHSIF